MLDAAQAFGLSERQWQVHEAQRPAEPRLPATGGATVAELRQLAVVLGEPSPIIDPALFERLRRAKERAGKPPASTHAPLPLVAAGMLALLGLGAAIGGQPVVAIVLLAVAALLVLPWLLRRTAGAESPGQEELRDADLALRKAQLPGEDLERRQHLARQRTQTLGLSPEAAALERLAAESEAAEQAQRESQRWVEERETLWKELQANAARLAGMLQARGVDVPGSPMAAFAAYREACVQRRAVSSQAARRPDLERRFADRLAMEAAAAAALARVGQVEQQVHEAARAIGAPDGDLDCLVAALTAWQQERGSSLDAGDAARNTWTQLQTLLAGASPDDFARHVQRQCDLAASLASDLDPAALAGFNGGVAPVGDPDPIAHEQRLADAAQAAQTSWDRARGQLEERRRTLGSIAEAEEAVAAARSELDRVLLLDETLALTQSFLEKAQQSVHRSVAPVLAGAVQRRLPAITAHRYREVRVDPENLDVQVLAPDGHWRHAALLSHGTAEQIYLLLRVALAQYLTKPGEVCPLILDDVTVHCDRERKLAVLETLHEISQERQVIVFSQEEEVLAWAEEHLREPNDQIMRLAAACGSANADGTSSPIALQRASFS